jgi:hypothetical protein
MRRPSSGRAGGARGRQDARSEVMVGGFKSEAQLELMMLLFGFLSFKKRLRPLAFPAHG